MISYTIKICIFDLRKNRNISKTFDEASGYTFYNQTTTQRNVFKKI